ncbi:smalltalk protein, partial [Segatella copri]
ASLKHALSSPSAHPVSLPSPVSPGYRKSEPPIHLLTLNQMKMKRETLKKILNFVITVLTAVASAFCVQSCQ